MLSWYPDKLRSKKGVSAACAELTCRFAFGGEDVDVEVPVSAQA